MARDVYALKKYYEEAWGIVRFFLPDAVWESVKNISEDQALDQSTISQICQTVQNSVWFFQRWFFSGLRNFINSDLYQTYLKSQDTAPAQVTQPPPQPTQVVSTPSFLEDLDLFQDADGQSLLRRLNALYSIPGLAGDLASIFTKLRGWPVFTFNELYSHQFGGYLQNNKLFIECGGSLYRVGLGGDPVKLFEAHGNTNNFNINIGNLQFCMKLQQDSTCIRQMDFLSNQWKSENMSKILNRLEQDPLGIHRFISEFNQSLSMLQRSGLLIGDSAQLYFKMIVRGAYPQQVAQLILAMNPLGLLSSYDKAKKCHSALAIEYYPQQKLTKLIEILKNPLYAGLFGSELGVEFFIVLQQDPSDDIAFCLSMQHKNKIFTGLNETTRFAIYKAALRNPAEGSELSIALGALKSEKQLYTDENCQYLAKSRDPMHDVVELVRKFKYGGDKSPGNSNPGSNASAMFASSAASDSPLVINSLAATSDTGVEQNTFH